jgi:hypothetical protein
MADGRHGERKFHFMYIIQAFISRPENLISLTSQNIGFANIEQGFVLIPVNKSFQQEFGIETFGVIEQRNLSLAGITSFGTLASKIGKVAYIEAEFFGGEGMQGAVMFDHGIIFSGTLKSKSAINMALKFLGVSKLSYGDEFEAIGLGKYRKTEDWIKLKN